MGNADRDRNDARFIDLSHEIEDGMITYPGIPAPEVCDFLSREASRGRYAAGTTFQMGRIDLVANTGTYLDSPFHRFADGRDIAQLTLAELADLPAVVLRAAGTRSIDVLSLRGLEVRGKAVLVHSGWAQHWRTERYGLGHPFLTAAAAAWLKDQGGLEQLPAAGFTFSAVPPAVRGMGSFPVRAYARL